MDKEVIRWLVSVPSTDGNFKRNLERATKAEVQQAISIVEDSGGKNKTKLTALFRELKRKDKLCKI